MLREMDGITVREVRGNAALTKMPSFIMKIRPKWEYTEDASALAPQAWSRKPFNWKILLPDKVKIGRHRKAKTSVGIVLKKVTMWNKRMSTWKCESGNDALKCKPKEIGIPSSYQRISYLRIVIIFCTGQEIQPVLPKSFNIHPIYVKNFRQREPCVEEDPLCHRGLGAGAGQDGYDQWSFDILSAPHWQLEFIALIDKIRLDYKNF